MNKLRYILKNIQGAVITRAIIGVIFGILVDLILHGWNFFGPQSLRVTENWERLFTLMTVLAAFSLSILLELKTLPTLFKRLRDEMFEANDIAESSPVMGMVVEKLVSDLAIQLGDVGRYTFTGLESGIPRLSIETISKVKTRAFATFVADSREFVYKESGGRGYLDAWYDKAEACKNQAHHPDLHRIFITTELGNLTEQATSLIEEHQAHGLPVSVIDREDASKFRGQCELDFLLVDQVLMTVKHINETSEVSVYVRGPHTINARIMQTYESFWNALKKRSMPAAKFLEQFDAPVNGGFWDEKLSYSKNRRLPPPHGLSKQDAERMVNLVVARHSRPVKIALLGSTPALIDACLECAGVGEITLIDQSTVELDLPKSGKKITPISGSNWLAYHGAKEFDGILGDEALNNLTRLQYRRFFLAMHRALHSDGLLVLRTMGRFVSSASYARTPSSELLGWIQNMVPNLNEVDRAANLIRFLHSNDIAFDSETASIRSLRYNQLLEGWIRDSTLDSNQVSGLWFPDYEYQDIQLSSLTFDDMHDRWHKYFHHAPLLEVDPIYVGSNGILNQFYRIMSFRPREIIGE